MNNLSPNGPSVSAKNLTLIGLMTAVLCLLGPIAIPLPVSPVPISFTNLAIYLAIYVLGTKFGTVSCALYLFLGTIGLPVFSGFSGGPTKLAGPTGGYLIGFLFMALIAGFFIQSFSGKSIPSIAGMGLGTAACYLFGTFWLSRQMNLSFTAALAVGVLPYLAGDIVKIAIAALLGPKLKHHLMHLSY